ncbi:MAG: glycosyltransferase family 4 protein [Leptospirales bacterium]
MIASENTEKLKNIKILVIQKMGQVGGAEKNLERWMDYFIQKYQVKISICGLNPGRFQEVINKKGIPSFPASMPDWRKGKNFLSRYLAQRKISNVLDKEQFDLIFVNDFFYAPYGVSLSHKKKIPIIVHVQSDIDHKRVDQYQLSYLDGLIVTTRSTFEKLSNDYRLRESLCLIQYGVDAKKMLNCPTSRKNIRFGVSANVLPHKGINFFMSLVKELKDYDGWEIHWVGGDPQNRVESLKRFIKDMNLSDKVFFEGFCENMESFYSSIDCLIHPAEYEPFGIAMIEAMSYGLPVLSTRTAGGIEILGDVDEGKWLVPLDEHKEMGRLMIELIKNPDHMPSISYSFYEKFDKNYRLSTAMEKMEACFTNALLSSRSRKDSEQ